jgi:hypothetical protein
MACMGLRGCPRSLFGAWNEPDLGRPLGVTVELDDALPEVLSLSSPSFLF